MAQETRSFALRTGLRIRLRRWLRWPIICRRLGGEAPTAIGHRIVHGGPHLVEHQAITDELLKTLEASVHFAPLHIPAAVALVRATEKRYAGVAQFACFDTAFHQTMPPEAYTYAIPKRYRDAGVRRYGFHGLSYESIVHALQPDVPRRLVVAHLGGGSSVCAIEEGRSVDTSMGVSPAGGVPMATRSGDLDPGVVLLMERESGDLQAMTPDETEYALNHESGLEALAGESDMQALLERDDPDAKLALAIYCREVAKTVAGYATVMGGVDVLVFTGGIGEHSEVVRHEICDRLQTLHLFEARAAKGIVAAADESDEDVDATVRVIAADEDGQIARHVVTLRGDS
jgi:acetate kinase